MNGLPDALAVLSAMITPAVLISGCGSLIMATAGRLNRAVDRTREISRRFAELAQGALAALDAEMDFVWKLDESHATPELLDLHRGR